VFQRRKECKIKSLVGSGLLIFHVSVLIFRKTFFREELRKILSDEKSATIPLGKNGIFVVLCV